MAREIQDTPAGGYAPRREAARVPKYEGFQVQARQMGYNPTSLNIARAPDVGFNAALDRASVRFDRMAEKVQAEQDDARVTEAITDLRRHATDLEAGENGWRKLLQGNALEPDADGKGLVERVDTDMRQYGEAIGEKLTGRQRAQFNRHAMNVYQSVYGGVSSHVATQGMEYQKTTYTSAIDFEIEAAATNGYKIDALNNSEARIIENADKLADLSGLPPDQYENLRRKYVSGMYSNAILGVMSKADTNPSVAFYADGLLSKNSKKMLGSDVMRLRKSIEVAKAEVDIKNFTDQIDKNDNFYDVMSNGAKVQKAVQEGGLPISSQDDPNVTELYAIAVMQGGGRTQEDLSGVEQDEKGNFKATSRYGASGISLENAYDVDKNVDVKKLLGDKTYNHAMGRRSLGNLLTRYGGDVQKAIAAYYSSPKVLDQAIKDAEASDNNMTWVEKLPKATQENLAKSMEAWTTYEKMGIGATAESKRASAFNVAGAARERIKMTPEQIREHALRTSPRAQTDPSHLNRMVNAALMRQNQREASYKIEQAAKMAKVTDILYQTKGDLSQIPIELRASFTRSEQADIMRISEKIRKGENTTNPTVANFYKDDATLRVCTMEELVSLRTEFKDTDYAVLFNRWMNLQEDERVKQDAMHRAQKDGLLGVVRPEFVPKRSVLKSAASSIQFLEDLKGKDKVAYEHAITNFETAIAMRAQRGGAPIVSERDVRAALLDMTNVMAGVDPGKFKSLYGTKAANLPNSGLTDIYKISKDEAKKRFGHEPSDLEILDTARDIFFNDYAVTDIRKEHLDEAVLKRAEQIFIEKKGRKPVGSELIRSYFTIRFSGEAVPVAKGWSTLRPELAINPVETY